MESPKPVASAATSLTGLPSRVKVTVGGLYLQFRSMVSLSLGLSAPTQSAGQVRVLVPVCFPLGLQSVHCQSAQALQRLSHGEAGALLALIVWSTRYRPLSSTKSPRLPAGNPVVSKGMMNVSFPWRQPVSPFISVSMWVNVLDPVVRLESR